MGKFTTFLLIMSGLMLLFHFAGLIETGATPNSALLNMLLDPSSFNLSSFYAQAALVFAAVGLLGGIVIGILTRNIEMAIFAPFTVFMITLLWDFLAVFNVIRAENMVIAVLIFGPILFLFIVSGLDWMRGLD